MIVIISILFVVQIISQAAFEAELLTPGQSNHLFQIMQLTAFMGVVYIGMVKRYNRTQALLVMISYVMLRFSLFDAYINHFRGLDMNYIGEAEVIKLWFGTTWLIVLRWISLIMAILCFVLFYLEDRYININLKK